MSDRQCAKDGMTGNTFPVYKVDAIVQFYRTEVLNGQEAKHFTRNDLSPSPKAESIHRVYVRVLQLCFRLRPEARDVMPFSEGVQHPMLYECLAAVWDVYLRLCEFLPFCHVFDFCLNDLRNPKSKRTISVLSAIQNYLHFRKQRMDIFADHLQSFRSYKDKVKAYIRETKEAEKKSEKLTTIPAEQQAEAKELDTAVAELKTSMQHQYQDVNTMNEKVAQCKTEVAEMSQKLTQKRVDVATLKNETVNMKSKIVESPEKLKNAMERMKETAKNIRMSKELLDERLVEMQMLKQCVNQFEAEGQVNLRQLQDLQSSMCKTFQRKEEAQSLAAMIETMQKDLKSLSNEEGQVKRALAMKLDKESKQQIRRQKKREVKDQQVKNIYGQYEKIHQKREENVKMIEERNRETKKLREKMQKLREKCNRQTQKAQEVFEQLLTTLEQNKNHIESFVVEANADTLKMKSHF